MKRNAVYFGDYKALEPTVFAFARKMTRELGSDLKLSKDARDVVFCHIFNCLWDPLVKEILRDQKRKKKLSFKRIIRDRKEHGA